MKIYNNMIHYIFYRQIGLSKYYKYQRIIISSKNRDLKNYE